MKTTILVLLASTFFLSESAFASDWSFESNSSSVIAIHKDGFGFGRECQTDEPLLLLPKIKAKGDLQLKLDLGPNKSTWVSFRVFPISRNYAAGNRAQIAFLNKVLESKRGEFSFVLDGVDYKLDLSEMASARAGITDRCDVKKATKVKQVKVEPRKSYKPSNSTTRAKPRCKKGKPCGNSCIAMNKTCRK